MTKSELIESIEAEGGDARAKLRRLWGMAGAKHPVLRVGPLDVDLAIRAWARHDRKVAGRLRRVDNRRMDYMRSQFRDFCSNDDDVEVRSMLAMSLWIGNHFIAADHGAHSRDDVRGLAMKRLLD